ncbi:iq calmodulin-binding domain-containing protein [Ophiostoma piceae UAMH 11346]|uniref:Iq calmodulin-binding domain-containing protein n=1 Tax=Ophiostoma piceae (strain UAMH 11346) TaxID=1262450 RepID=S3CE26_OPHP1|nr:iq calmodulin-binding domain-containing protein [Ophiostoma piceae UAMH 11346]
MLETLTILPMAPGTRSRRTDVLHRATPVMLKPRQRQTTLDQHLQQTRQQAPLAASSTRPPPLQAPSRQSRALQQHTTDHKAGHTPASRHPQPGRHAAQTAPKQHTTPPSRQQTLLFAIPSQTRSPQDTSDHAESMSSARPKRKAAVDADADARGGDATKRGKPAAAASGGPITVPAVERTDATGSIGSGVSLEEAIRKRPRLAVEILDYAKTPTTQQQQHRQQQHQYHPQHAASSTSKARQQFSTANQKLARDKAESSTTLPHTASIHSASQPRAIAASRQTHATEPPPHAASKSKEKLVHGIKHELKSLQLAAADAVDAASVPREGGRKLRSQEATRFKSELSAYFPEYDEVIGNEPKEEHALNVDTPIVLVEQSAAYPAQPYSLPVPSAPIVASLRSSDHVTAASSPVKGYGDKLFYDVFDSHVLDFTFLGSQYKNKGAVDPLPDSCFEANHKRAERVERSIRNTEKGRAQHEKDQIIRLLDGLQGPDWLRTMGVSGITESKKKTFEPARDHFISGCRVILDKFRTWSLEEKRRKLEKDRAHAEEVKARESATAATAEPRAKAKAKADTVGGKSRKRRDVSGKDVPSKKVARSKSARDEAAATSEPAETDGDETAAAGATTAVDEDEVDSMDDDSQPDSSDFDAVIALQLREEALARSRVASKLSHAPSSSSSASKRRKTQKPSSAKDASSLHDPVPPLEEVKSFFEKPYQREAALSRSRRKGRTVMAWGRPVPEPPQTEFNLPGEIMDKDDESKEAGRRTRGNTRSANK